MQAGGAYLSGKDAITSSLQTLATPWPEIVSIHYSKPFICLCFFHASLLSSKIISQALKFLSDFKNYAILNK